MWLRGTLPLDSDSTNEAYYSVFSQIFYNFYVM